MELLFGVWISSFGDGFTVVRKAVQPLNPCMGLAFFESLCLKDLEVHLRGILCQKVSSIGLGLDGSVGHGLKTLKVTGRFFQ